MMSLELYHLVCMLIILRVTSFYMALRTANERECRGFVFRQGDPPKLDLQVNWGPTSTPGNTVERLFHPLRFE